MGTYVLYELDDAGEATGVIYYFCSEDHRAVFRSTLGNRAHAPGLNTDAIEGTVCDHCGTVVVK